MGLLSCFHILRNYSTLIRKLNPLFHKVIQLILFFCIDYLLSALFRLSELGLRSLTFETVLSKVKSLFEFDRIYIYFVAN